MAEGGIVPPHSVFAPESALGSVPTGALSSAQVNVIVGTVMNAWNRIMALSNLICSDIRYRKEQRHEVFYR